MSEEITLERVQELVTRAALQLDQLERLGIGRCFLVRMRRLNATTDVRQRIA